MSKKSTKQAQPSLSVQTFDFKSKELDGQLHLHDEMQILAGNAGMLEVKTAQKKFNLRVGDVMIIKRRTPHSAKAMLPFTSITAIGIDAGAIVPSPFIQFSAYLSPVLSMSEESFIYLRREESATAEIFSTITHISEEKAKKQKSYEYFIEGYSKILLGLLDRLGILDNCTKDLDAAALSKLLPALNYLEENCTREITLEEIAKTLDMNREYFCRLFKKTLGISFVDYTNFVRISRAEELLISSQLSISDISDSLGFSSVSYFTRVFKNITNLTPSSYRNIKNY